MTYPALAGAIQMAAAMMPSPTAAQKIRAFIGAPSGTPSIAITARIQHLPFPARSP
jgi:hypothetical protein